MARRPALSLRSRCRERAFQSREHSRRGGGGRPAPALALSSQTGAMLASFASALACASQRKPSWVPRVTLSRALPWPHPGEAGSIARRLLPPHGHRATWGGPPCTRVGGLRARWVLGKCQEEPRSLGNGVETGLDVRGTLDEAVTGPAPRNGQRVTAGGALRRHSCTRRVRLATAPTPCSRPIWLPASRRVSSEGAFMCLRP